MPSPSEADSIAPFEAFSEALDSELRGVFRHLVFVLSYAKFQHKMSAAQFQKFAKLAVADEWWEVPDEQMAEHLDCAVEDLEKAREMPYYGEIKALARDSMEAMASHDTMAKVLEDEGFRTGVLREVTQLARYASNPWIRQKASEALLDRMAPKLSQAQDQGPKVLVIDGELANRLLQAGEESVRIEKLVSEPQVHAGPAAIPPRASGE